MGLKMNISGTDLKLKRIYSNGKIEFFTARVWDIDRFIREQNARGKQDKETTYTVELAK